MPPKGPALTRCISALLASLHTQLTWIPIGLNRALSRNQLRILGPAFPRFHAQVASISRLQGHRLLQPASRELRAVIATNGTIQSLQAVSGDPLFYQSAMDAVRQWRYTPTVLNGEAVEIDTFITVIYNINR
jgi:Gram-negative bacterial TonB protein C-terminal